jgi:hypothetical protein
MSNSDETHLDDPIASGCSAAVIAELTRLAQWVRSGNGINREDAIDDIARAIENRALHIYVHGLEGESPKPPVRSSSDKIIRYYQCPLCNREFVQPLEGYQGPCRSCKAKQTA